MLKFDEIEITGNGKTLSFYRNIGYDLKYAEKIFIKIKDLIETSAMVVDCFCDICKSENRVKYYNYVGNIKRNGLYRCNECSKLIRSEKVKELFTNTEIKESIILKTKNTNLSKYGVDNPMLLDVNIKKSKNKKFDKYGDVNYNNGEKNKITCLGKYGVDSYSKTSDYKKKYKKTCNDRYGVDNVFKSAFIKQKIKNTLIEKYGVDNPMKFLAFFEKAQKSSIKKLKYDKSITYQGSYELDFINYCISKNIKIENGPVIDYIHYNLNRKYYSDFYLPDYNLIIEIKSSWTFKRDYDENISKEIYSKSSGFNFIFIIDKDYSILNSCLSSEIIFIKNI
jgi:hypothetical protein